MYLNARRCLQALLAAWSVARGSKKGVAVLRGIGAEARDVLLQLLIAARPRRRENFRSDEIRCDAFDIPAAADLSSARRKPPASGCSSSSRSVARRLTRMVNVWFSCSIVRRTEGIVPFLTGAGTTEPQRDGQATPPELDRGVTELIWL
ncbi:MAG TPA: hypothetical protein VKI44_28820 [Acetobacteraceae bacterium]|nr:hypothetical protein [Acetobacteraceae bacterium]